jgi:hypothetical protein
MISSRIARTCLPAVQPGEVEGFQSRYPLAEQNGQTSPQRIVNG